MPATIDNHGWSANTLSAELDALVSEVETEERRSATALKPQLPEQNIEREHQAMLAPANALAGHQQMKQLHSAMFKVHRKLHQRHELALHHCRLLQSRARQGSYGSQELLEIVRQLRGLVSQIKWENELMVRDREKMKREHDAFMASLPPRDFS